MYIEMRDSKLLSFKEMNPNILMKDWYSLYYYNYANIKKEEKKWHFIGVFHNHIYKWYKWCNG